jgi:hypothetical protein
MIETVNSSHSPDINTLKFFPALELSNQRNPNYHADLQASEKFIAGLANHPDGQIARQFLQHIELCFPNCLSRITNLKLPQTRLQSEDPRSSIENPNHHDAKLYQSSRFEGNTSLLMPTSADKPNTLFVVCERLPDNYNYSTILFPIVPIYLPQYLNYDERGKLFSWVSQITYLKDLNVEVELDYYKIRDIERAIVPFYQLISSPIEDRFRLRLQPKKGIWNTISHTISLNTNSGEIYSTKTHKCLPVKGPRHTTSDYEGEYDWNEIVNSEPPSNEELTNAVTIQAYKLFIQSFSKSLPNLPSEVVKFHQAMIILLFHEQVNPESPLFKKWRKNLTINRI